MKGIRVEARRPARRGQDCSKEKNEPDNMVAEGRAGGVRVDVSRTGHQRDSAPNPPTAGVSPEPCSQPTWRHHPPRAGGAALTHCLQTCLTRASRCIHHRVWFRDPRMSELGGGSTPLARLRPRKGKGATEHAGSGPLPRPVSVASPLLLQAFRRPVSLQGQCDVEAWAAVASPSGGLPGTVVWARVGCSS